ncbi:MAG: hypothetical protein OXT09_25515, partial [Myxococcales bacterium]|nr:hypothetical protein [Myxococcales bacterium]
MQWTESGGLNRAGLLLVGLASIACLACEAPQGASPHSEPLPEGALASVPEAESEEVEIYPGSTPQVVQLARVHGYGNP